MSEARATAGSGPVRFAEPERCADAIVERVGRRILLALPLGLGKANHVANALFARVAGDSRIELEVLTALTLEKPRNGPELQQRLVDPIVERLFGNYPDLAYAAALREGRLPRNIKITEFFLRPGAWLDVKPAQQCYTSLNYTHVSGEILARGVNVVGQLIAKRETANGTRFSLSCNPDVTLDILPELEARRASGVPIAIVGQVNRELPFMAGDAEVASERFDYLLEGEGCEFKLFAQPRQAVSLADYAAGLRVAALVKDGGTLQIGIGSIGDAIAYGLILRHRKLDTFRAVLSALGRPEPLHEGSLELAPFTRGLYGSSEMLVDGFIDLYRAGILKRRVCEDPALQRRIDDGLANPQETPQRGPVMHAAFFFGSKDLYRTLRELADAEIHDIAMTAVSFTNSLRGNEMLKRAQRRHARFINNAMMATLLGDVVSDALDDGKVVSGVGGQHDLIAQAHELDEARAIIVLNSTFETSRELTSNIRWTYAHTTVPRHLRDIIVTEYGVADLRGKSDRDCIAAMAAVADARFQPELLAAAKRAGKIEADFAVPEFARRNRPEWLAATLAPFRKEGLLAEYPFGTDLTPVEQRLARALRRLKQWSSSKPQLALRATRTLLLARASATDEEALARLDLARPATLKDRLYRALVLCALRTDSSELPS
ncbi:MAG TPA: acetyl-CoA hydrolase/transferase C-terminal domain-containing protein [Casimicrobiaceae bacterium]|nr:acetyl-CoA hydrolase/transferase C-terminal domain-containing protein [Casimicrobiaceae bacterium]